MFLKNFKIGTLLHVPFDFVQNEENIYCFLHFGQIEIDVSIYKVQDVNRPNVG